MEQVVAIHKIEFALLPSFVQRRSGYRPNHKHPLTGEFFLGEVMFTDGHVNEGATATGTVRLWLTTEDHASLMSFGSWSVWEASTHVGAIKIMESAR
ncbi:hypothetical protein [Cognatiluteimonas weifangensis]